MKKRISFRLHMSLIMFSTVSLGFISNYLTIKSGLELPVFRYPFTVLISYGWFLLLIRFYIRYILLHSSKKNVLDSIDVGDPAVLDFPVSSGPSAPGWSGDGGQFSGGGATGAWDTPVKSSSSSSSFGIDSIDLDEGAIVVVALGALLLCLLFGTGAYLIWQSPEILSECLLQVVLVSGMRKGMKKFSETEWMNHMLKATLWPFVGVLVVSVCLGFAMKHYCPDAKTILHFKDQCLWKK